MVDSNFGEVLDSAYTVVVCRCRICLVFSFYVCFPKLDVAGSNPVSRSILNNLATASVMNSA
jgi:hypothetical protein